MAYIFVNSFKQGLDARRSKISAQQGSLVSGKNVHINRGGEIEKRKAFVAKHALPAGTFGLHATRSNLYTFGSVTPPTMPAGVTYQQLVAPSTPAMTAVISTDTFAGVPYVVASFANGAIHHFYNGVRVTDWDAIVGTVFTLGQALASLVTSVPGVTAYYSAVAGKATVTIIGDVPGVVFTLTSTATGLNGNSPTVAIANVTGTSQVVPDAANLTLNGDDLTLGGESLTIANVTGTSQVVQVEADLTLNGDILTLGGEALTISTISTASSVVTSQVSTVTLTSANNTDPIAWSITVNGVTSIITTNGSVTGSAVRTFRNKMYATGQGLLYFSDTENPAEWTPPTGTSTSFAGFENLSSQTGQSDTLVAMAPYQNYLAVFARRATQIWSVVAGDPVSNVPVQILDNIGTVAPRSAINFGELDVFFLSDTGIRSLRARDASNSAVVYDVGTSIDPLVITRMKTRSEAELAKCCGVIEPREGRYMLAIGSEIFVYSFFPASNISAWTTYETGFTVSEWAVQESKLYARSGNTVYLYGGDAGETYDTSIAAVELSWLDADKAAHRKRFHGIDASCEGTWRIDYSTDPVSNQFVLAGHVIGQNFSLPSFGIAGYGTHVGFKFTSSDASAAKMSSFACHFEFTDPPK